MTKRKISIQKEDSLISKLNKNLNDKTDEKVVTTDTVSPIEGPDYDAVNDEECNCDEMAVDSKESVIQRILNAIDKNDLKGNENLLLSLLRYANAYLKPEDNKRLDELALLEKERLDRIFSSIDRMKDISQKTDELFPTSMFKDVTDEMHREKVKEVNKTLNAYEMVNHPDHYNNYDKEVIDMIEAIWGTEKAAIWCEITAFKYRMRMGTKPDNDITQDISKEKWYLNKFKELKSKYDRLLVTPEPITSNYTKTKNII